MLPILALFALASPGHWNLPGANPHLVFHYMPWFTVGKGEGRFGPWNHWRWDGVGTKHNPEVRLSDGRRDIASAVYPLVGPYSSSDRDVVRYHMQTIRAAGGEAVAVDWNTTSDASNANVPLILDEAKNAGLKVTLCYEEKANYIWPDLRSPTTREEVVANVVADFNYVLKHYASHPAFLRRDGKPFFFQFNGWGDGKLGHQFLSPAEYRKVISRIAEPIELGRQGLESEYDDTAKARYLWFAPKGDDIRWSGNEAGKRVAAGNLDFYMGFVCPGFDDSGVSGWSGTPRVIPRAGLSFLWGTFKNAFTGDPELVQVVTWNDFNEGTVVEPTRENGFQYLDALATWWAQRAGTKPDLTAIRRPYLEFCRATKADPDSGALAKRSLVVAEPGLIDRAKSQSLR